MKNTKQVLALAMAVAMAAGLLGWLRFFRFQQR